MVRTIPIIVSFTTKKKKMVPIPVVMYREYFINCDIMIKFKIKKSLSNKWAWLRTFSLTTPIKKCIVPSHLWAIGNYF